MESRDDVTNWVKSYTKILLNYTLSKVPQKDIAEDLVQETFLVAYQSYEKFQGNSSEKTWLFSILKHKIADHYRSKYHSGIEYSFDVIEQFFDEHHRWQPAYRPQDWSNEKALLDDSEFAKTLKHCFDSLPDKWSSAVQLKYLEEHDAEMICSILKISKTNFWQIIHRAKLQLRNCLELKWFKRQT